MRIPMGTPARPASMVRRIARSGITNLWLMRPTNWGKTLSLPYTSKFRGVATNIPLIAAAVASITEIGIASIEGAFQKANYILNFW